MIPEVLLLVEQIGPRTTQIDDLRTPIAILLKPRAFEAVEGVRDTLAAAHDTLVLVVTKGAFIAYSHESGWANVGVADWTFAVAFVAETADGDA